MFIKLSGTWFLVLVAFFFWVTYAHIGSASGEINELQQQSEGFASIDDADLQFLADHHEHVTAAAADSSPPAPILLGPRREIRPRSLALRTEGPRKWRVPVTVERLAKEFPVKRFPRYVRFVGGAYKSLSDLTQEQQHQPPNILRVERDCRKPVEGGARVRKCTSKEKVEYQMTARLLQTTLEESGYRDQGSNFAVEPTLLWLSISLPLIRVGDVPIDEFHQLETDHWINRIPGAETHLNRKDLLARNIREYLELQQNLPGPHIRHPETFLLPEEWSALQQAAEAQPDTVWIFKPAFGGQGMGIQLYSTLPAACPEFTEPYVAQRYISNPFLIDGKKHTIRLYALITSLSPLRLYLHETGIIKMATGNWTLEGLDLNRHVTNQAANKGQAGYTLPSTVDVEDVGSRWSVRAYRKYLREKHGVDDTALWAKIKIGMLDMVIAGLPHMLSRCESLLDQPAFRHGTFQLLGVDIDLVQTETGLEPVFIEANVNPTLKGNAKLPFETAAKYELLTTLWAMVGLGRFDANLVRSRMAEGLANYLDKHNWRVGSTPKQRKITRDDLDDLATLEYERMFAGNFTRLFPSEGAWKSRQPALEAAYRGLGQYRESLRKLRLSAAWAELFPSESGTVDNEGSN